MTTALPDSQMEDDKAVVSRTEIAKVQAGVGPLMTFAKAVWKTSISWGVPTVMRT